MGPAKLEDRRRTKLKYTCLVQNVHAFSREVFNKSFTLRNTPLVASIVPYAVEKKKKTPLSRRFDHFGGLRVV